MFNSAYREVEIMCEDGHQLSGVLLESTISDSKGLVIMAGAIGVSPDYYASFLEHLSEAGYDTLRFYYRGTGLSSGDKNAGNATLCDWGKHDLHAVIEFAHAYLQGKGVSQLEKTRPIHFVGHSVGGQILGLAPSAERLSSAIFVASSAPYWKRWPFPNNLRMWLASKVLIPGFSVGRKEFPSHKLGLGNLNIPVKAARQWAKWMSRPEYLFDQKFGLDLTGYPRLSRPILSYGFEDDSLAPKVNVDLLAERYSNSTVTRRQVTPGEHAIGHSGFFKPKHAQSLWTEAVEWLDQHSDKH